MISLSECFFSIEVDGMLKLRNPEARALQLLQEG